MNQRTSIIWTQRLARDIVNLNSEENIPEFIEANALLISMGEFYQESFRDIISEDGTTIDWDMVDLRWSNES